MKVGSKLQSGANFSRALLRERLKVRLGQFKIRGGSSRRPCINGNAPTDSTVRSAFTGDEVRDDQGFFGRVGAAFRGLSLRELLFQARDLFLFLEPSKDKGFVTCCGLYKNYWASLKSSPKVTIKTT